MTAEEIEAFKKKANEWFGKISQARQLARNLQVTDARAMLTQAVGDAPLDQISSQVSAEISLLEDHYDDALLALAPTLGNEKQQFVLLMGAYAAAMDGQVFSGQTEYSNSATLQFSDGMASLPAPGGRTYATSSDKCAAALALALWYEDHNFDECATHYYVRALEIAPNNAMAGYSVGRILVRQHHAAEAVPYLETAVAHSNGRLQATAKRQLLIAKGRAAAVEMGIGG